MLIFILNAGKSFGSHDVPILYFFMEHPFLCGFIHSFDDRK